MNLVKTSMLSFIATAIKLLSSLVINKAIALYVGPSGLALLGQFQSFSQIAMVLSQGGVNTGVTKYTAEYGPESPKLDLLFSTALKITVSCSIVIGLLCIIFSGFLSPLVFKNPDYKYVFIVFGCTVIFFSLNQLLLAILNGLREIKTYISINISQSIYALFFTTLLIYFFGIDGALIAMATNQSVVFLVVIMSLKKYNVIQFSHFRHQFSTPEAKRLLQFSLMALVGIITLPTTIFIIRSYIVTNIGIDEAGHWQAVWSISSMYLMVVSTAITIYFIPKLSQLSEKSQLRLELISGFKILVPIVITMAIAIYWLKDWIILILFSKEFFPATELFKWQLVGDVIKICGWLLANLMLSKALTKSYLATEVLFSLFLLSSSIILLDNYGLIGVTYAYVISYVFYFFMVTLATRKIWL